MRSRPPSDPKAIRVLHAPCMGRCAGAPAARVGDREVDGATVEGVLAMARAGETKVRVPAYTALDAYRRAGRLSVAGQSARRRGARGRRS